MKFITFIILLANLLTACSVEHQDHRVEVSDRKILVDKIPYSILGVCYNPVEQGEIHRSFERLSEDLELMQEAGINTVRVYSPIKDVAVLDAMDEAGIKVIIGFGYNQGGEQDILSGTFINYVRNFKDHPAILLWELGNEYNYHPEWFEGDIRNWYRAMNDAAELIHAEDPGHPVSTAHGELPDSLALSSCPAIDVWGMNVYRWDSPESIIEEWKEISDKPMYLSEAGADSYMTIARDEYEEGVNEQAQADAVKNILEGVFNHRSICSGVTLFAFTDEWWKAGDPAVQDKGGRAPNSSGVPYDGSPNEEYWGILDVDRNKKAAFQVVGEYFRNPGYFTFPVIFGLEDLQADFAQFRSILESTHPALYDFIEKEELDSLFDMNYAKLKDSMEMREFLLLMTEVISQVGCGHSSMWIPSRYWWVAPERLFPLKLTIVEDKVYVAGSYREMNVLPAGSEILAINGEDAATIIDRLINLTSKDGYNLSYRREKAGQNFSVKYAIAFGFPEVFKIRFREAGGKVAKEAMLEGVSKTLIDQQKPYRKELSFREEGGVGVLTINSFGYYSEVSMFHSFIDSVFHVIEERDITDMIMDLRHNSGGDPFCASYLWGYLQPASVPYFEDHYGSYDTLANPIPLPDNHYTGRLLTLIDGNCFSTTGHLLGLLEYHAVGEFVGQESGATYTCTGNATYPGLDNTWIMVGTARVTRYTTAVDNMDPTRGILPDHPVELTQQDIIEGNDATMIKALELLDRIN